MMYLKISISVEERKKLKKDYSCLISVSVDKKHVKEKVSCDIGS